MCLFCPALKMLAPVDTCHETHVLNLFTRHLIKNSDLPVTDALNLLRLRCCDTLSIYYTGVI